MDLTSTLRDLTSEQPAQPGDRVAAVTRRAGRIRRTRVAAATAALVVLAGSAFAVTSLRSSTPDTFAAMPISQWPDRSYDAERGVAEGAVVAWWAPSKQGSTTVSDIHWLFRGRIHLPEADRYVAVFTAMRDGHRWLVASSVPRGEVDAQGQSTSRPIDPNVDPWTTYEVNLDSAPTTDHAGLYIPYHGTGSSGTQYGEHLNVLFLLAAPGARQVRFLSSHLPGGQVGPQMSTAESPNGVFVSAPMTLDGPVTAKIFDGPATWSRSYPLSTSDDQPQLSLPDAPDLPSAWGGGWGSSGQSQLQADGKWTADSVSNLNGNSPKPMTVRARCYGGGVLTFILYPLQTAGPVGADGNADIVTSSDNAPASARGTVPCDGSTHQAFTAARITTDGFQLEVTSDRLQAFNYVIGSPSS